MQRYDISANMQITAIIYSMMPIDKISVQIGYFESEFCVLPVGRECGPERCRRVTNRQIIEKTLFTANIFPVENFAER